MIYIYVFPFRYLLCIYELAGEVYTGAVERLRLQLEQCCGKNRTKGWIVMDWVRMRCRAQSIIYQNAFWCI